MLIERPLVLGLPPRRTAEQEVDESAAEIGALGVAARHRLVRLSLTGIGTGIGTSIGHGGPAGRLTIIRRGLIETRTEQRRAGEQRKRENLEREGLGQGGLGRGGLGQGGLGQDLGHGRTLYCSSWYCSFCAKAFARGE